MVKPKSVKVLLFAFFSLLIYTVPQIFPVSGNTGVDWWPMFGHDLAHSRYSSSNGPRTNTSLWTYSSNLQVRTVVVFDGVVYAGSYDGTVFALNANMGALIWSVKVGNDWCSIAVDNGKVFVGCGDGILYVLNAYTGGEIWKFNAGGGIYCSPTVNDGIVYLASEDVYFYALDADTGGIKWKFQTATNKRSSPTVAGGVVYVRDVGETANLYAIDIVNGSKLWDYPAPCGTHSDCSPAVVNGVVYFGSIDSNVYALDARTGLKKWNYTTGGEINSSPAIYNGVLYIGSDEGNFYALNIPTGSKKWEYPLTTTIYTSPLVADGVVYVGLWTSSGFPNVDTLLAFDAGNGSKIWGYRAGRAWASPVIANGVLYVGSYDIKKVYAFGTSDIKAWATDFNYINLAEMQSDGWAISNPERTTLVPGGGVILNGSSGAAEISYSEDIPDGIYDWKIDLKAMWLGVGHSGINVKMATELHSYMWAVNGTNGQYVFFRDGVVTLTSPGFTEKTNEYVYLTIERNSNVISLYHNGTLIKNFVEPDTATSQVTSVSISSPSGDKHQYIYLGASVPKTKETNPTPFVLNVSIVGNGVVSKNPDKTNYQSGEVVQLTATPGTGYDFTGWSGDHTGTANTTTVNMTSNKTITATFTKKPIVLGQYTLTVSITGSGVVSRSPDKQNYQSGEVVQLTATPGTGYDFTGWSGEHTGTANTTTVTLNANKTITAMFTQVEYSLNITVVGNGVVGKNPNKPTYHYGDVITLTATPKAGWAFSAWSGNLVNPTNPDHITVNGNEAVTVTFTQNDYTLTISIVGSGLVSKSPDKLTYLSDEAVQLTATPGTGYDFTGWSGEHTGTASTTTVNMTSNKAITATFTKKPASSPTVITSNVSNGTTLASSRVTLSYENQSPATASYEVRVDGGAWVNVGDATSYTASGLPLGEHEIEVRAINKDGAVLSSTMINVETSVWVPPVSSAVVSGVAAVSVLGIASLASATMMSSSGEEGGWLAEKLGELLPDGVKNWLESFVSTKRSTVIDTKAGPILSLTKLELIAYAVEILILTLAYSYAGSGTLSGLLLLIPTVLATSVAVGLVKNLILELITRALGVWAEHRVWIFGLTTFLVTTLLFRAPFSSPSRTVNHSGGITPRIDGLVAFFSVLLSLGFAAIFYVLLQGGSTYVGSIGLAMCLLSALYDAVPIAPMNGRTIYAWNKLVWAMLLLVTTVLYTLWLLYL